MRLRLAARSSDLARIQAYDVGEALSQQDPKLEIEYIFRKSWGDQNLDVNLTQIPDKGAFTQDFIEMLERRECDLVVHSWKDLPTDPRLHTEVVATIARAAQNDVLLFLPSSNQKKNLRILSSSPRREYCLSTVLKDALPWSVQEIKFEPVRGNVPTRIDKLLNGRTEQPCDGLIVAQAALDRLLSARREEFQSVVQTLRAALTQLSWMVLPLTENPTAPAQGALAIEIHKENQDLKKRLKAIDQPSVFADVLHERDVLRGYGGGCHARLGVSRQTFDFGSIEWRRGFMNNSPLHQAALSSNAELPRVSWSKCWPQTRVDFERREINIDLATFQNSDLYVARAEALPPNYTPSTSQLVWCSGWKTWTKLARRGIWVHGCSDGLGELSSPRVDALSGRPPRWVKLTHQDTVAESMWPEIATYAIKMPQDLDLKEKRCFFWSSPALFDAAKKSNPEILGPDTFHAAGPGKTYRYLQTKIPQQQLRVYLSFEDWLGHFQN